MPRLGRGERGNLTAQFSLPPFPMAPCASRSSWWGRTIGKTKPLFGGGAERSGRVAIYYMQLDTHSLMPWPSRELHSHPGREPWWSEKRLSEYRVFSRPRGIVSACEWLCNRCVILVVGVRKTRLILKSVERFCLRKSVIHVCDKVVSRFVL